MLPNRIHLSQNATDKLRFMKSKTGLTPNILSRVAIMLAIEENGNLTNAGVLDYDGQELNQSVLFGEHIDVYDVLINQFVHDKSINQDLSKVIASLIEVGVFKMRHIKDISHIASVI
jgi:DNA sulfur modification protein DndE